MLLVGSKKRIFHLIVFMTCQRFCLCLDVQNSFLVLSELKTANYEDSQIGWFNFLQTSSGEPAVVFKSDNYSFQLSFNLY